MNQYRIHSNIFHLVFLYMVSDERSKDQCLQAMSSSSSDSSTIVNIQHSQSPSILTMSNIVTVKLSPNNYILWKAQMVPYFLSQDLFGYLASTIPKPSKFVTVSHPKTHVISETPNPAYSH